MGGRDERQQQQEAGPYPTSTTASGGYGAEPGQQQEKKGMIEEQGEAPRKSLDYCILGCASKEYVSNNFLFTETPLYAVFVNGKFCKNPVLTTANDFLFSGLQVPRSTANPVGSTVITVFVGQLPGLNTLGISMVRIDFGIGGLNPPHIHPRGSEILLVLEGTLCVGFVTSNQLNHTFFEKVLHPGDVFVFPFGMIHFQLNVGKTNAVAIAGLSSQNPGVTTVANDLFNAKPPISPEVLAKGFQVDEKLVETLQKKFWYDN
ncbi:germin-like protein subfamily 1 member 20 [Rhodamnia argentea]|uniref:Germin-like protein n=1 Tax=Rhodamnia argentea TaxID=178133 RepID=A0ABM3HBM7_9MYRT|nr:germin-like protein subfamily 1 member 20 [Rhodamnia argentea]